MFHKEGSCQGQAKKSKAMDVPLRKSDRRMIRTRIGAYFSVADSPSPFNPDDSANMNSTTNRNELLEQLLDVTILQGTLSTRIIPFDRKACRMVLYLRSPSEESSTTTNALTEGPSTSWPYTASSQFIWIALEEKQSVVAETPTVALWAVVASHLAQQREQQQSSCTYLERLLQRHVVYVPCPVSKFVCRGADLMKAGMLSLPQSYHNYCKQGQKQQSSKSPNFATAPSIMVAICVQGNVQPFAVGRLKLEKKPTDMLEIGPNTKGIGVEIFHSYGDDLWRHQYDPNYSSVQHHHNNNNFIGGAPWNNGHFGNVGFSEGRFVYPLKQEQEQQQQVAVAVNEDEEEGKEAAEGDATTKNPSVWDSPEDAVKLGEAQTDTNYSNRTGESPDGEGTSEEPVTASATTAATMDIGEGDASATNNNDDNQKEQSLSAEDILHLAVCKAIASLSVKQDLPMTVANFYAQHVLPNRPDGTTIQLKATKYKKFGKYVTEQVERGLLQVGPDASKKDPMAMLLGVNRRHQDIRTYQQQQQNKHGNPATISSAASTTSKPKKLVIVTLYIIPSQWVSLLRLESDDVQAVHAASEERRGTGMLTASELCKILDDYILREGLVDPIKPDRVVLDGPLTDVFFKSSKKKQKGDPNSDSSSTPESMPRKDAVKVWSSKMNAAYAVVEMPGSKIIEVKRGVPLTIDIEVSKRQGKKYDTRVRGLEDYNIDPVAFSKDISKRFACSGTVETDPVGRAALKKGRVELVFQGNLAPELEALLCQDKSLSNHGGASASSSYPIIPKSVLNVTLRKGVPGSSSGKKK